MPAWIIICLTMPQLSCIFGHGVTRAAVRCARTNFFFSVFFCNWHSFWMLKSVFVRGDEVGTCIYFPSSPRLLPYTVVFHSFSREGVCRIGMPAMDDQEKSGVGFFYI